MNDRQIEIGLQALESEFGKKRVTKAVEAVKRFKVEIPSWLFGAFGGGRFGDYLPPGCARNISEKLDDAACVHRLTGATEYVATHVLWDFSEDGETGSYQIAAKDLGCGLIVLWLPDGSLYPGQIELRQAWETTKASLLEIAGKMDNHVQVLIEYKVFEPGTYSTVLPDWGSAYVLAKAIGPNAGVLVDMGHHHHSVNVEQIVARLVSEGMYGGFHFNTRYAADDDHAVEPNPQMARIFYELAAGGIVYNDDPQKTWAYMIDQCSGRENRIHAILHSIDSLQISLAKAMLVDRERLEQYQQQDEIIMANRIFNNALMHADVRPLVAAARLEKNLPADPVTAYLESGYQQKIEAERS